MKSKLRIPIFIGLIVIPFLALAQPEKNYKNEMIESGEKAPFQEETQNFPTDYSSFLKAKAWNSRIAATFNNPSELTISIIGGRVRSTLADATNSIYLVAPSGGGLFKFTPTTGTPFTPINDFGSFLAITDIAQDPNNAQHIIVATGDENHSVIGNGLFKSTNGGNSFTNISTTTPTTSVDFNYIRFVKFSPQTANTVYMAADDKLFKSTDAGATWTEVFNGNNYSIRSLEFLSSTGVLIAVDGKGLYTSTTGNSSTFSLITTTVPNFSAGSSTGIDGVVAATYAGDRNIIYALFSGTTDGLFKSTDGGSSWTSLTLPGIGLSQAWFCLCIGVHPTNSNKIICGGVGCSYSLDGGSTFVDTEGFEVDFHSVNFHPSNPDIAYIGYDQGFGSLDFSTTAPVWQWNGSAWVQVSQQTQVELGKKGGFNTTQIYYGDYFPSAYGDSYVQGQQDGGCFIRHNSVEKRFLVGDGGSVFVNKQSPNTVYASTQNGNIKSTSTAMSVTTATYSTIGSVYNDHPNWITNFAGNNSDGTQMYIATNANIQRTNNSGTSFTNIASHTLDGVKIACQSNADPIVYCIGYKGGSTWNSDLIYINNANTSPADNTYANLLTYSTDGTPDQITVDPNTSSTIYVTGSRGTAYKVTNANTAAPTITSIRGNIPTVTFNIVIGLNGMSNTLVAGTNVGLFLSTDGGTTWTICSQIPYTKIMDLKFRNSDDRLFVFTHGRGAWAITISNSVVQQIQNADGQDVPSAFTAFPNPNHGGVLKIQTDHTNASYKLYDSKGEVVLSQTNITSIDTGLLKPGMYILHQMVDGKLTGVEKIIVK